ncbi:MAG: hypothetical protein NXY59_06030 [Aigarchaeota archaeon]|nr:hypothetical protein [Candidatus Pelearchaeum maunauluense]
MSSRVAKALMSQTRELVRLFNNRVMSLHEQPAAAVLTRGLGGGTGVRIPGNTAIGIDGSMDYDERLEMLFFYVAATGYRCPFTVQRGDISFDLKRVERDERLSTSAAVPLWLEDLSNIASGTQSLSPEHEFRISVEKIPFALMTMAELYLALRAVRNNDVGIVFLDRPLSGTHAPLSKEARILLKYLVTESEETSSLVGMETSRGKVTVLDLDLAAMLGPGDLHIPLRRGYRTYAAIQLLIKHGSMNARELAARLNLPEEKIPRLLQQLRKFDKARGHACFSKCERDLVELKGDVRYYWDKVLELSLRLVDDILLHGKHPFYLGDDRGWLSVQEINIINLFLLYELMHESRVRDKLLIGITKDTAATDFTRAVIPFMNSIGRLPKSLRIPVLKNDRAFLTILSSANPNHIRTPWRTIAYDACFFTLVENVRRQGDEGPLKPARRVVSRERLFIKAYFQTREFKNDPRMRSLVFAYDRIYNPRYDSKHLHRITVREENELSTFDAFFEADGTSELDSLILNILFKTDNPEVLECLGHNQLLYLADKAVKAEVKSMKATLRGVADLQLGTLVRRERMPLIVRRFRDIRAEAEYARIRAARGGEY